MVRTRPDREPQFLTRHASGRRGVCIAALATLLVLALPALASAQHAGGHSGGSRGGSHKGGTSHTKPPGEDHASGEHDKGGKQGAKGRSSSSEHVGHRRAGVEDNVLRGGPPPGRGPSGDEASSHHSGTDTEHDH